MGGRGYMSEETVIIPQKSSLPKRQPGMTVIINSSLDSYRKILDIIRHHMRPMTNYNKEIYGLFGGGDKSER